MKLENQIETKNDKIYVGQSVDIKKRWREHKRELNNNSHYLNKIHII